MELEARIGALAERRPLTLSPLDGGSVARVLKVEFAQGPPLVAKTGAAPDALECEAWMLGELLRLEALPVPRVVALEADLLLLEWLPNDGTLDRAAQAQAADFVAGLHARTDAHFGFERDTVIGGLPQPNPRTRAWLPFLAEHRLLHMTRLARDARQLPAGTSRRVERLCERLDRWLIEPERPSLLHGDLWRGNILCARDGGACRVSGFIDPALYYGAPEIELAYIGMFGGFEDAFFARYRELRPIAEGFFEERRALYTLYPLLVHVRLLGGGYADEVERLLNRFGA